MTFRLGMAVCLCGIVACSHHTAEPARTAAKEEPETWAMRPASLEGPVAPNADTPTGKTAPDADPLAEPWPSNPKVAPSTDDSAFFPDDPRAKQRDTGSDLTLLDQNSPRADMSTTQDIRAALLADKSLADSGAAKSVKISTKDGNVTLSGSVKSDEQRRAIDLAARRIAGALKVENRIEVTP